MFTYHHQCSCFQSKSDLTGNWHFVLFKKRPTGNESLIGTISFDGLGATAVTGDYSNQDGTVVISPGSSAGTCTVNGNGTISLDMLGDDLIGRLTSDGELGVLSGGETTGDAPCLMFLTPVSISASASQFGGSYAVVSLNGAGNRYSSLVGRLGADGVDEYTMDVTYNSEDSIPVDLMYPPISFAVAASGRLAGFTVAPSYTESVGAVSPSGKYAFLGGPIHDPNTGSAIFLIVK